MAAAEKKCGRFCATKANPLTFSFPPLPSSLVVQSARQCKFHWGIVLLSLKNKKQTMQDQLMSNRPNVQQHVHIHNLHLRIKIFTLQIYHTNFMVVATHFPYCSSQPLSIRTKTAWKSVINFLWTMNATTADVDSKTVWTFKHSQGPCGPDY